jgi:multimeric flavodoxin WrbA
MVDEIIAGAKEAGANVEKVMIGDLNIMPCDACAACRTTGECVKDDDMKQMLEKLKDSHVWIIGTPVYWWGPTAQLKAFIDRWYAKADPENAKEYFAGHRVVLAIPLGDNNPQTARHLVGMFQDALDYVKGELFASVLAPGAYDMGDVKKMEDVLKQARQVGHDVMTT